MSERGAQKNTFGLQKIQEECKTATNSLQWRAQEYKVGGELVRAKRADFFYKLINYS